MRDIVHKSGPLDVCLLNVQFEGYHPVRPNLGPRAELARWSGPYDRNEPYNRTSWLKPFSALSPAVSVMAD